MHEREEAAPRRDEAPAQRAAERAGPAARDARAAALLRMQASAGNRATARLLARDEKVTGPSPALRSGTVTSAAASMAAAASGHGLRTAKDEDTRATDALGILGIAPAAEGQPKPVPDDDTKKAADAATGLAMSGASGAAQGVIENLLRGGGPKTQ
jgi:hypothetical protein